MVGHEVEDQTDPARSECLARGRQAARTTEVVVNDVVPNAVGRPDDVGWTPVRQSRPEARHQVGVRQRDRNAGRASLPHPHQPDRVGCAISDLVPVAIGDVAEIHPAPSRAPTAASQAQVLIS